MWRYDHYRVMSMNDISNKNCHKKCHHISLLNCTLQKQTFNHSEMWITPRSGVRICQTVNNNTFIQTERPWHFLWQILLLMPWYSLLDNDHNATITPISHFCNYKFLLDQSFTRGVKCKASKCEVVTWKVVSPKRSKQGFFDYGYLVYNHIYWT